MKTHRFEETLPETGGRLDLNVECGQAAIRTHANGRFVTIEAELEQMTIDVSRRDGRVSVYVQREEGKRQNGRLLDHIFKNVSTKANITIHVPADCEIDARVVAGDLTIDGIAAPVTSRVIAGRTTLHNLNGPIYAKTTTGDLGYSGVLTADQHRFEATTGRVRLQLRQTPDAYLDARAVTGSVGCTLPLKDAKMGRRTVGEHLSGILGSGKGQIKAHVTTGSVRMEEIA